MQMYDFGRILNEEKGTLKIKTFIISIFKLKLRFCLKYITSKVEEMSMRKMTIHSSSHEIEAIIKNANDLFAIIDDKYDLFKNLKFDLHFKSYFYFIPKFQ